MRKSPYEVPTCDVCNRPLYAILKAAVYTLTGGISKQGLLVKSVTYTNSENIIGLACGCRNCDRSYTVLFDEKGRPLKGERIILNREEPNNE